MEPYTVQGLAKVEGKWNFIVDRQTVGNFIDLNFTSTTVIC